MSNRPQKPSSVLKGRIDWGTVIIPFLSILALCLCFILAPDASKQILGQIRTLFGDTFGLFYLIVGLGVFLLSIFLAFFKIWDHPSRQTGMKNQNTATLPGAA